MEGRFPYNMTNGPPVLDSVVGEWNICVYFPLKFEIEAISGRLMREIEEIEELGRDFDTQHKMCSQGSQKSESGCMTFLTVRCLFLLPLGTFATIALSSSPTPLSSYFLP